MRSDKKRLNHSLSNGLLITHALRHRSGVFVLFVSDLQNTERVIFDGEKVVGDYGFSFTGKENGEVAARLKKVFEGCT